MKENKKLKLLLDAAILGSGVKKNYCRSGIYFVAINFLKYLTKRSDIQLSLFCTIWDYKNVKENLKNEFPNIEFDIITDKPYNSKTFIYEKIKDARKFAKEKKQPLFKFLIQGFLFFLNLFMLVDNLAHKLKMDKLKNYDAFFSPVFEFHRSLKKYKVERYTILYDLIPLILPEYRPEKELDSWFYKLLYSLNSKDNYFSISEYTRQDFLKHCPQIDPNKIHTTLLACADNFKPVEGNIDNIKTKYNIPLDKKYIFSLCTLEPRKNLIRSVKTFVEFIKKHNIDDLVFVLGGGQWDNFIGQLEKEVIDLGDFKSKIIKAGYVDDEDLAPLYSNAQWFVYTSRYEGFGLPPLEAMSCGCPVITSNNSSLPEVVGNSGIMIDWDSDIQHIEAYENYYFNEQLRKENSKKGLERAKEFSWDSCFDEMIEIMRK